MKSRPLNSCVSLIVFVAAIAALIGTHPGLQQDPPPAPVPLLPVGLEALIGVLLGRALVIASARRRRRPC